MAKKRLTGNNKTLSDDWEETLRQIRTQTAVDFTMTGEEKARKLRELEADPVAWAKFMFYRYAKYEFAGFQKKAIRRIIGHSDGNWYEVLSWARELAKSTIVMFIVLYLVIVKKNKRCVIMTSATNDGARKLLNQYRAQFEANERLKYFYGNLIGDKWTEDYFTLSTRVSFMAMGWGQSPRGVKMDEVRPDVLLMDDYDTDEECRNPEIVNNKWNWFEQALFLDAVHHIGDILAAAVFAAHFLRNRQMEIFLADSLHPLHQRSAAYRLDGERHRKGLLRLTCR